MFLRTYATALILVTIAAPVFAQISATAQDVGEIYQTNSRTTEIAIENAGAKPLTVLEVKPKGSKDAVGKVPKQVPSHSTAYVPVTVFSGMDAGNQQHIFLVKVSQSGKITEMQVLVRLFVLSVLDDARPAVDLGTVDSNSTATTRVVSLNSREVPEFRIERVLGAPDFASAKILVNGHTLVISSNPKADWGRHQGFVRVKLNSPVQPEAWIRVTVDIHGEIIPSQDPLDLGLVRNTEQSFIVQLKSRDNRPVKLGRVSVQAGLDATTTTHICNGDVQGCAQINLKLAADQPGGRVEGILLVDLPDYGRQLKIAVGGVYLSKDIKVRSLNEMLEKSGKASAQPSSLDLKSALQRSTQTATLAPANPAGRGPLLKWQTSNEGVVYGYVIYRADTESGQYLRVNKNIVRVARYRSHGETSAYVWRDTSAAAGRTYWYYIGLINKDGSKQQLSGPQKVIAK